MASTARQFRIIRRISRQDAFGLLRILFGFIWLLNTWFQANSTYINHLFLKSFDAGITGQPQWLAHYTQAVINAIQAIGPPRIAVATVALDGLLAFSLLTGIEFRFLPGWGLLTISLCGQRWGAWEEPTPRVPPTRVQRLRTPWHSSSSS